MENGAKAIGADGPLCGPAERKALAAHLAAHLEAPPGERRPRSFGGRGRRRHRPGRTPKWPLAGLIVSQAEGSIWAESVD